MNSLSSFFSRRLIAARALAAGLGLAACDGSGGGATTGGSTTGDADCAPSEVRLEDGRCQPPGLPLDMKCQPGETPLEDGSCQAAGVPPSRCGDGFDADGE